MSAASRALLKAIVRPGNTFRTRRFLVLRIQNSTLLAPVRLKGPRDRRILLAKDCVGKKANLLAIVRLPPRIGPRVSNGPSVHPPRANEVSDGTLQRRQPRSALGAN